jgi:CheY-like chemotaxis protein
MSPASVLLIEDSPDDAEFAKRVFQRLPYPHTLTWADDGAQGLLAARAAEVSPALVLMDVNLAGQSGVETLRSLKQDPALRCVPVVMLTTSKEPADVSACYAAGANSYHQKPTDFHAFERLLGQIAEYWLSTSVPPVPATKQTPPRFNPN